MRKKSTKVIKFIDGLHEHIINNPQFRKNVSGKSEVAIQAEIRPLIITYLQEYFKGYKDPVGKANKSFYWEGQEGQYGRDKKTLFASRNYPEFIIKKPYLIAVEYKKASSGSTVKQAIGQSLMHTLSGEFEFVYVLFHDENSDKKIKKSITDDIEKDILKTMQRDFNVFIKVV